jgi:hypothetical protein
VYGAHAAPHAPFVAAARMALNHHLTKCSLLNFAALAIGTIVTLTLTACSGGYQIHRQWLERWGNAFTALVLIIIGALVLGGVI